MFSWGGKVVHVDSYISVADYTQLPKADLVLICHEHQDHLDPKALGAIRTEKTVVVANPAAGKQVEGSIVMKNGDVRTVEGLKIEAVPAYNVVHKRDTGEPFHPKGVGNGYVITFGDNESMWLGIRECSGDEAAQEYRRRLPSHESALYDDP